MKKLIILDYKIQSGLIALFFITLLLDLLLFQKGICIVFYFLLALIHLISSNVKFYSKSYSKNILFKIYYIISMTYIVSITSLLLLGNYKFSNEFLDEVWSAILFFGILGTPFLAIIYYLICDNDYSTFRKIKTGSHENT